MTQEAAVKQETPVTAYTDPKQSEKRKVVATQEILESLKGTADDIGQISELSSEEKILVTQFFKSLFKLMQPLAPSIPVNQLALPVEVGDVLQAHVDPTGHLAMFFADGHMELKDLREEKNRELMIVVVGDIIPKFKNLTSAQKRNIESRIKFISSITKEIQKSSEALSAVMLTSQP